MAEKFVGTKFSVELTDGKREMKNAAELIDWCRKFHGMGLASVGDPAGNISVRTKRGFLITPSGKDFSKISAQELVEVTAVNEAEKKIKAVGSVEPSSEAFLHAGIYGKRKEVNAILHGHNPAVTKNPKKFGLVETAVEKPYGTIALRDEVLKILGNERLVQMKGHGFITMGSALNEAGKLAEMLYEKSVKQTVWTPNEKECMSLLSENNVPENVIEHSRKVAELAVEIAEKIKARGIKVDVELVRAGALLHDLDKIETLEMKGCHGSKACERLRKKGLHELAEIARKHVLEKAGELKTPEEKIVFYADKRVVENKIVSLRERLDFIRNKYGSRSEEAMKKILACEPAVLELEKELMAMSELPTDKAVDFLFH